MFLDKEIFTTVLQSTPLVALDFIVYNTEGKVLLGQRLNRPAQGYWFVPGGRIYKNEAIAAAFSRLTLAELGQQFVYSQAQLLGIYDHFYTDSVFGEGISTHYVVAAHQFTVQQLEHLPEVQHDSYAWFDREQLLLNDLVHPNTKAYFLKGL
jgi:colanic acid biosynthesis protein WcaH